MQRAIEDAKKKTVPSRKPSPGLRGDPSLTTRMGKMEPPCLVDPRYRTFGMRGAGGRLLD